MSLQPNRAKWCSKLNTLGTVSASKIPNSIWSGRKYYKTVKMVCCFYVQLLDFRSVQINPPASKASKGGSKFN